MAQDAIQKENCLIPKSCPVYLWWKLMAELAQKEQRPAAEDYCLRRQKEAEIKALNKAMMEAM